MAEQRMVGDILSERRRSLGLSIDRVVADTKLQRRMVDAFEDSDFDAMPPKGYAQASLASYARYLGLNPNEVLRVYDDQLYEYQRSLDAVAREAGRDRDGYGRRGRAQGSTYECDHDQRDRYAGRDERTSARRGASVREGGRYEEERQPYDYDTAATARDRSARRSSGRTYDRGLYESGYRRQDTSLRVSSGYGRDEASSRYDRRPGPAQGEGDVYRQPRAGSARGDDRARQSQRGAARTQERAQDRGNRRAVQVVTLDDGYQGGSGGPESQGSDTYRPRPARGMVGERQSFSEAVRGFLVSIQSDRRAFFIIVGIVALTLVVVVAVGVSSCMRGHAASEGETTIPVTSIQAGQTIDAGAAAAASSTPLASSIDLLNLPANTTLALTVEADAPTSPWIEVSVDGLGVYASITAPATSLQWTVTQNATLKLSSVDGVSVYVNGTAVTPTYQNATYELTLAVAADQQPQPDPVPEG